MTKELLPQNKYALLIRERLSAEKKILSYQTWSRTGLTVAAWIAR